MELRVEIIEYFVEMKCNNFPPSVTTRRIDNKCDQFKNYQIGKIYLQFRVIF